MKLVYDDVIFRMQKRGGISRLFREIISIISLKKTGYEISLMTENKQDASFLSKYPGIKLDKIPSASSYYRPGYRGKPIAVPSCNIIPGKKIKKIWHSTYYSMLSPWDGYSVVTVVDMIYELFPELFCNSIDKKFIELKRACVEASDAVITISEASAKDIVNYYGINPERVYPIHLSANDTFKKIETDFKEFNKHPYILYVGGRYHYKNFKLFIEAYSKWSGNQDYDLLLVGAPLDAKEIEVLTSLKIADKVNCFTDIDDEELCKIYNSAEAFIYPSLYEGFGIPLLEAMACGCPVVASTIPTTKEVAGDYPYYFDPVDESGLINSLDKAVSQGVNNEKFKKGIERVNEFSWEKTAIETLKVYDSVLEMKNNG